MNLHTNPSPLAHPAARYRFASRTIQTARAHSRSPSGYFGDTTMRPSSVA